MAHGRQLQSVLTILGRGDRTTLQLFAGSLVTNHHVYTHGWKTHPTTAYGILISVALEAKQTLVNV